MNIRNHNYNDMSTIMFCFKQIRFCVTNSESKIQFPKYTQSRRCMKIDRAEAQDDCLSCDQKKWFVIVKEQIEFLVIVAVLRVDIFGYKTNKRILTQAKRLDHGTIFNINRWEILQIQTEKMKKHTLGLCVWLYDFSGIQSIKAHTVVSLEVRIFEDMYVKRYSKSLEEFVQNRHRDLCISNAKDLSQIRNKFSSRSAIFISISDNDREHDPLP